jgi:hypothetical protein
MNVWQGLQLELERKCWLLLQLVQTVGLEQVAQLLNRELQILHVPLELVYPDTHDTQTVVLLHPTQLGRYEEQLTHCPISTKNWLLEHVRQLFMLVQVWQLARTVPHVTQRLADITYAVDEQEVHCVAEEQVVHWVMRAEQRVHPPEATAYWLLTQLRHVVELEHVRQFPISVEQVLQMFEDTA